MVSSPRPCYFVAVLIGNDGLTMTSLCSVMDIAFFWSVIQQTTFRQIGKIVRDKMKKEKEKKPWLKLILA